MTRGVKRTGASRGGSVDPIGVDNAWQGTHRDRRALLLLSSKHQHAMGRQVFKQGVSPRLGRRDDVIRGLAFSIADRSHPLAPQQRNTRRPHPAGIPGLFELDAAQPPGRAPARARQRAPHEHPGHHPIPHPRPHSPWHDHYASRCAPRAQLELSPGCRGSARTESADSPNPLECAQRIESRAECPLRDRCPSRKSVRNQEQHVGPTRER